MIKKSHLIAIAALLFLNGCVTGTRSVTLEIPEQAASEKRLGAVYIASIEDLRVFEHKPSRPEIPSVKGKLENTTVEDRAKMIGRQRNGYGGAMGGVSLPEDGNVQQQVKKLVASGLASRGYLLSDTPENAVQLDIDIKQFWAWMVPGFVSVGFESSLEVKLDANGKSNTVVGVGNNEGQVASNANWALTYKRAYTEFLANLDTALAELGL